MAAATSRPASAAGTKSKTKAPAKSKTTSAAAAGTSAKAGPSTNAVCVSLQDLKRQASSPAGVTQKGVKKARASILPLSPSQVTNKQKEQQQTETQAATGAPALVKMKTKSKAIDDNSTNDEHLDGTVTITTTAATVKPAATGPRRVTFPSSPRKGVGGNGGGNAAAAGGSKRNGRILSTLLHVNSLNSSKVRGKIVYQYDEVTVDNIKYRVYYKDLVIASSVCFRAVAAHGKPADMTIDTWKVRGKYEQSEEYFVDCIAAQRLVTSSTTKDKKHNKNKISRMSTSDIRSDPYRYEYLLKYTRFELDPGNESWLSYEEVDQTAAMDTWEKIGRKNWEMGMMDVKTAAGLEV
jgi:hypothetical protein